MEGFRRGGEQNRGGGGDFTAGKTAAALKLQRSAILPQGVYVYVFVCREQGQWATWARDGRGVWGRRGDLMGFAW